MLYPTFASSICIVDVVVVFIIVTIIVVVNLFSSNAISSEVYGPINFNFYVRHPGVGIYLSYENYDFWSVIIDVSDRTDQTSNTISSEVYGPISFKFYVRHLGVGLY